MRVLVLGGTGMLGHVLADRFAQRCEVHTGVRDPSRARRLSIAGEPHAFNAREPERLIEQLRPDVVINAVGLVKQLDEASRPVPAISLNALLPHLLAQACAERGARLIHISTDCVFSGTLPAPRRYTEDDAPDARDLYGRSKLLGEVTEAPGLTLRTSIIGRQLERATGLLEWFLAQAGGEVRGFTNAIYTGLTTHALARVMEAVVIQHPGLSGLYQVASAPISKHELLMRLRDAFGLQVAIEAVDEPRINRALDGSRFREATGIEVPSWDAMISEYHKEIHDAHA